MRKLTIPALLIEEFATVDILLQSKCVTRRVDALLLCWVKYEKQLRRLFCFLVYQHPKIDAASIKQFIAVLAENRELYPATFTRGIAELSNRSMDDLVGSDCPSLTKELIRVNGYRNKLIHGQISGQGLASNQLEQDIIHIVSWVQLLAVGAKKAFGYDGLERNTFRSAKQATMKAVAQYPFANPDQWKEWLTKLSKKTREKKAKASVDN